MSTSQQDKPSWIVTIGFDAPTTSNTPLTPTPTPTPTPAPTPSSKGRNSIISSTEDEQEEREHEEFTAFIESQQSSHYSNIMGNNQSNNQLGSAPKTTNVDTKDDGNNNNKKAVQQPQVQSNVTTATVNSAQVSKKEATGHKKTIDEFSFGDVLGQGSFGQVKRATEIATGTQWAVKILDKKQIVKLNKADTVQREKKILDALRHPNIVHLYCTFQDAESLYFMLEYCPNGELLDLIKKAGRLEEPVAKFYAAELLNAVQQMHNLGIIHRDIKPENILLNPDKHSKLSDFGTALIIGKDKDAKATDFAGTAEYIAPELLVHKWSSKISDIWAIGCVIYQMLVGKPPFKEETEYLTFKAIQDHNVKYPQWLSPTSVDIIQKLLEPEPTKRLGFQGIEELKSHPFFAGMDFSNLHNLNPPKVQYAKSSNLVQKQITKERARQLEEQSSSIWAKFLLDNELIVHTSLVWKKKQLRLPRKRQLLLTDLPRIIYIDAEKMQQKGEIEWGEKLKVKCQNEKRFSIKVPGRTYLLQEIDGTSSEWYEHTTKLWEEAKQRATQ